MSSKPQPTTFLNVHSFGGKQYAESEVLTSRAAALKDAEEWSDRYVFTLTEFGRIDLRDEFSERYQRTRGHDELMDARIDDAKEQRSKREAC
jgi:hypothetical protein